MKKTWKNQMILAIKILVYLRDHCFISHRRNKIDDIISELELLKETHVTESRMGVRS